MARSFSSLFGPIPGNAGAVNPAGMAPEVPGTNDFLRRAAEQFFTTGQPLVEGSPRGGGNSFGFSTGGIPGNFSPVTQGGFGSNSLPNPPGVFDGQPQGISGVGGRIWDAVRGAGSWLLDNPEVPLALVGAWQGYQRDRNADQQNERALRLLEQDYAATAPLRQAGLAGLMNDGPRDTSFAIDRSNPYAASYAPQAPAPGMEPIPGSGFVRDPVFQPPQGAPPVPGAPPRPTPPRYPSPWNPNAPRV